MAAARTISTFSSYIGDYYNEAAKLKEDLERLRKINERPKDTSNEHKQEDVNEIKKIKGEKVNQEVTWL